MTIDSGFPQQGAFNHWLKRPNLKGFAYELDRVAPDINSLASIDQYQIDSLLDKCGMKSLNLAASITVTAKLRFLASKATIEQLQHGCHTAILSLARLLSADISEVNKGLFASQTSFLREAYQRAIDVGPVTEAIRTTLFDFGQSIGLEVHDMEMVVHQLVMPRIQRHVDMILADAMMSPDEEASLNQLAADLGGTLVNKDAETDRVFRLARMRWQITQGILPMVDCPLMLKKGEICHAVVTAMAYEERQRTVRAAYSGLSTRIRIIKGVYYNAGSYRAKRTTEAFSFALGMGHFIVTNKRVLFSSAQKSIAFAIDSIVDWTLFSDGIELRRSTGKAVTYVFGDGNGLFLEVLIAARKNYVQ